MKTKSKAFPKNDDKVQFKTFAEETSLHGFRYLVKSGIQGRNVVWALLLLGAAAACVYFITDTVLRYRQYKSHFSTKVNREKQLHFPAVTVCNLNLFNATSLEENYPEINRLIERWPELPIFNESQISLFSSLNLFMVYNVSGCKAESLFVYCGFGSIGQLNCLDWLTPVLTQYGQCYTFNGLHIKDNLSALGPGLQQSVQLTLDASLADFKYAERSGNGFAVIIHDQEEYPNVYQDAFLVKPGVLTQVAVKKVRKTVLDKPYSNEKCFSKIDSNLKERLKSALDFYQQPYSQSLCLVDCFMHKILFKDICSFFVFDNKSCSYWQYLQLGHQSFQDILDGKVSVSQACEYCHADCTTTTFTKSLSYADFPNPSIQSRLATFRPMYNSSQIKENLLQIQIFFETLDVTILQQLPVFSMSELYSNVGGIFGLFLGASIISVLEIVDFLLTSAKKRSQSRKNQVTDDKVAEMNTKTPSNQHD